MSKSTPLSQLPSSQNDLDDPLVQEVLAEIAQSNDSQQQANSYVPQMTPTPMYNGNPAVAPREFITPPPPAAYSGVSPAAVPRQAPKFGFDDDIKVILLVVVIAFVVQVFPFEQFVYKYVSVQHIPYSNILIKAILAGALFFLAKKYFL